MSLKKEFLEFINTKPIEPFATLPQSGIDVEWSDFFKAWKIDMGMDVNEFLERNPDLKANIITKHPELAKFIEGKATSRTIMKRGLAEAILNELIEATDVPFEADRLFKGQRLRNVASGTLTAQARDELYENAQRTGQLPERTSVNEGGGVRQTSRQIKTRPSKGGLHLGEVPDDIAAKEFERYVRSIEKKTGIRVEDNSFEFEGHRYGFQQASLGDRQSRPLMYGDQGYVLYRSADKLEVEANRRALQLERTPYMSQDEWLEIRDIYRRAADLGLEVDHIQPLELLGLHHPRNLQLLSKQDNRIKSSAWEEGGDNFQSRAIDWERPTGDRSKVDTRWAKKKSKWSWNNSLDKVSPNTLKHIDGISRYGNKAEAWSHLGFSAASGDLLGTAAAVPGVALTTNVGRKGLYKALQKFGGKRAQALLPGLGLAGNTLDVARYTAQGRGTQAWVAGAAGVLDELQNPITEGFATLLQLGNTVTDYIRGDYNVDGDIEDPDINKNTLKNIGLEDYTNWRRLSKLL